MFGHNVTEGIRNALLTIPIKRKTPAQGSFSAVASATGKTAGSVNYRIDEKGVEIFADINIENILTGTPPGYYPPINDIDYWLAAKGLDLSPHSISNAIFRNGTSIWQEFQGSNSGVLDGVLNQDIIDKLVDDLAKFTIKGIMEDIKQIPLAA